MSHPKTILTIVISFFTLQLYADECRRPADMRSKAELEAREMSHAEYVSFQEERAQRSQEQDYDDELVRKSTYFTTHEGSQHKPIAVAPLGDIVKLEDSSCWAVQFSDRYKTLDWMTGDSIIITPNHRWFSSYYFKLINEKTGVSVLTNLATPPGYSDRATHWITVLDISDRIIALEDGSVWEISIWDRGILQKWLTNDTIMIGIEDGWFYPNPNILINASMKEINYVSATCIKSF